MRVEVGVGEAGEVHRVQGLEVVEGLLPLLLTPGTRYIVKSRQNMKPYMNDMSKMVSVCSKWHWMGLELRKKIGGTNLLASTGNTN